MKDGERCTFEGFFSSRFKTAPKNRKLISEAASWHVEIIRNQDIRLESYPTTYNVRRLRLVFGNNVELIGLIVSVDIYSCPIKDDLRDCRVLAAFYRTCVSEKRPPQNYGLF